MKSQSAVLLAAVCVTIVAAITESTNASNSTGDLIALEKRNGGLIAAIIVGVLGLATGIGFAVAGVLGFGAAVDLVAQATLTTALEVDDVVGGNEALDAWLASTFSSGATVANYAQVVSTLIGQVAVPFATAVGADSGICKDGACHTKRDSALDTLNETLAFALSGMDHHVWIDSSVASNGNELNFDHYLFGDGKVVHSFSAAVTGELYGTIRKAPSVKASNTSGITEKSFEKKIVRDSCPWGMAFSSQFNQSQTVNAAPQIPTTKLDQVAFATQEQAGALRKTLALVRPPVAHGALSPILPINVCAVLVGARNSADNAAPQIHTGKWGQVVSVIVAIVGMLNNTLVRRTLTVPVGLNTMASSAFLFVVKARNGMEVHALDQFSLCYYKSAPSSSCSGFSTADVQNAINGGFSSALTDSTSGTYQSSCMGLAINGMPGITITLTDAQQTSIITPKPIDKQWTPQHAKDSISAARKITHFPVA
ncbi:hypothetical protein HDU82_007192 [Entophlyctis luteolus]|nr:hypothetical protein HDU82_007192 [Entophlyctis luteolus]